jgi:hypothetical protein
MNSSGTFLIGSLLFLVAALCNFVSAGITWLDNGRPFIIAIQLLAAILMIAAAVSMYRSKR